MYLLISIVCLLSAETVMLAAMVFFEDLSTVFGCDVVSLKHLTAIFKDDSRRSNVTITGLIMNFLIYYTLVIMF